MYRKSKVVMSIQEPAVVAVRAVTDMGAGDRAAFDATMHPDAVNREAHAEPPNCRGVGPEAFWASALWLRAAFPDLRHEPHVAVVDGELVVVHATMSGTHRGPFVVYDAAGRVEQVFAPTDKTFAVTQTHWFRMRDGLCAEHWANRDDLGMGQQLGWFPPSPRYLWQCAQAKRAAQRTESSSR